MKVVFHPGVASDLDAIFHFLSVERPEVIEPLQRRIEDGIARVSVWPALAPVVAELGGDVRALTLARFPYRIFYRVRPDAIVILHVRHAAQAPWEGGR